MTTKEKTAFKKYCRRAKKACPPALRCRLVCDLHAHLTEFLEASPHHGVAGFLANAGDPDEFAAAFAESVPLEERRRLATRHHRVKIALLSVGIALVVSVLALCVYIFIESDPFATYTYEYSTEYHTTIRGGGDENAV